MLKKIPRLYLIAGVAVLMVIIFASGFVVATWRNASRLADADKREQDARAKIAANDAENNRLRGVNEQIRKDIAELSAEKAAILQNIKEHGGAIASETKKIEQINEQLKTDQAVIAAPSDSCTRCRRFSANAIKQRLIDKPLSCELECRGSNQ